MKKKTEKHSSKGKWFLELLYAIKKCGVRRSQYPDTIGPWKYIVYSSHPFFWAWGKQGSVWCDLVRPFDPDPVMEEVWNVGGDLKKQLHYYQRK